MMTYSQFLKSKEIVSQADNFTGEVKLNPMLFGFQRDITTWALRRSRACIWADCGLGKTPMQLEWINALPGDGLIVAPLGVAQQTVSEGEKFGVKVKYCRQQAEVEPGITICNYEMLEHFDEGKFNKVVLDESSILKNYAGKFRNLIISKFRKTPFRLACTATPAPNDYMELGNHAEFVGAMSRTEMLSMFFVHDGGDTSKWRLKGHAEKKFWKWVASWAVMLRRPSDLGYPDDEFTLPKLHIQQLTVESKGSTEFLFPMEARTLSERISARRDSLTDRVSKCAELVNSSEEQWLIWCNLNNEADELELRIKGGFQVKGSEKPEHKTTKAKEFQAGNIRVLITKPSIFGYGMNWQHCHNVAFVGLSDSWEEYYQAVRRIWRFGQKREVNCYLITSTAEGAVLQNIQRKERDAGLLALEMVNNMSDLNKTNLKGTTKTRDKYKTAMAEGKSWLLYLGDSVEVLKSLPEDSIDFSIFSPPFASLYTYSASERDMGNCRSVSEFGEHFKFLMAELFRLTKPGRLLSFHCMNLPTTKTHHGYIGLQDFRGILINWFQEAGFIFHSEVCIWKDPVTAMQRTHALGLLYKQLRKDSAMSRQGVPDYLVTMRKPGSNKEFVSHKPEDFPVSRWQQWASPVWMDIDPNDTLQRDSAREEKDEKHICPLQLEVIRRALLLWSNPGDLVLSPFAGIGSEGYESVKNGRRFVGVELKDSYWRQAKGNLETAELAGNQIDLLSSKEVKPSELTRNCMPTAVS